jgi:hypothetical protein
VTRINVHVVAFVLAVGLVVLILGVMTTAIINVAEHGNPTPTLGENSTQVLTAIVGGLVGVLGSYIGYAMTRRHNAEGDR